MHIRRITGLSGVAEVTSDGLILGFTQVRLDDIPALVDLRLQIPTDCCSLAVWQRVCLLAGVDQNDSATLWQHQKLSYNLNFSQVG